MVDTALDGQHYAALLGKGGMVWCIALAYPLGDRVAITYCRPKYEQTRVVASVSCVEGQAACRFRHGNAVTAADSHGCRRNHLW